MEKRVVYGEETSDGEKIIDVLHEFDLDMIGDKSLQLENIEVMSMCWSEEAGQT